MKLCFSSKNPIIFTCRPLPWSIDWNIKMSIREPKWFNLCDPLQLMFYGNQLISYKNKIYIILFINFLKKSRRILRMSKNYILQNCYPSQSYNSSLQMYFLYISMVEWWVHSLPYIYHGETCFTIRNICWSIYLLRWDTFTIINTW